MALLWIYIVITPVTGRLPCDRSPKLLGGWSRLPLVTHVITIIYRGFVDTRGVWLIQPWMPYQVGGVPGVVVRAGLLLLLCSLVLSFLDLLAQLRLFRADWKHGTFGCYTVVDAKTGCPVSVSSLFPASSSTTPVVLVVDRGTMTVSPKPTCGGRWRKMAVETAGLCREGSLTSTAS